jgi:hypothetical protein
MSPADISAEWLSQVLGPRFPGLRVTGVEILDAHAGTTGRARLRLRHAGAPGAPDTVFVKLPPADPGQRELVRSTGMGRREARFYAAVAEDAPLRLPHPLFAASSEDGSAYIMLLEDLAASGCTFRNAREGASLDYTREVIASLARLHARFWNSSRFAGDLAWVRPLAPHPIGPVLVKQALDRFGAEMPPVFSAVGRLYVEHTARLHELWEEGEATLVHGDAHIGNLFEDAGCAGFLDWACLARMPGIRDVSYFLTNSVPTELRRREERALLELYRERLAEAGAEAPDFETLWRRHRRHAVYSWVAAATTIAMGDAWQPLRYAVASTRRANDALADLASVALLEQELG